ncbi:MAG: hypothetical protein ACKOEX_10685, partial [Planctomycetia bacterium]
VALGFTVLGLSAVNISDALETVLDGRTTIAYWAQTGLIALYFILLVLLHAAGKRGSQSASNLPGKANQAMQRTRNEAQRCG